MEQKVQKDIIQQLKQIKSEKNLTIPQIIEMLEENNKHLAKNTVVRVFSEKSDEIGFQEETIRSIADVMLNVYHEDDGDDSEIKGLKSTIKLQNILIEQLKERLASSEKILDDEKISALRRIDFLRDRIEKQDIRIEQKDRLITILLMIFIEKHDKELTSEYGELVKMYFKQTIDDVSEYLKQLNPKEE